MIETYDNLGLECNEVCEVAEDIVKKNNLPTRIKKIIMQEVSRLKGKQLSTLSIKDQKIFEDLKNSLPPLSNSYNPMSRYIGPVN